MPVPPTLQDLEFSVKRAVITLSWLGANSRSLSSLGVCEREQSAPR